MDVSSLAGRFSRAWAAGRVEPAERATVLVRDLDDRDVVYVCRHDEPRGEPQRLSRLGVGPDIAVEIGPGQRHHDGRGRLDLGEAQYGVVALARMEREQYVVAAAAPPGQNARAVA